MKAVTFGEIMLRLKTPEYLRIVQSNSFEASYGGSGGKCSCLACNAGRSGIVCDEGSDRSGRTGSDQ